MKTQRQQQIKRMDDLWSEIVKKRAGYKSEYSGKDGKQIGGIHILNAHHILGKPNNGLRYELEGGYCCTREEHLYGFHATSETRMMNNYVETQRPGIFERLQIIKNCRKKVDLDLVELYLESELKKL